MHRTRLWVAGAATAAAVVTGTALAQTPDEIYGGAGGLRLTAKLDGYQQVPSVSTTARGTFRARVVGRRIRWTLSYRRIEGGDVQAAHIHFAQRHVNGGVAAFLCASGAGAPAGVQACPARRGTLRGTIRAKDVVGPAKRGIGPGATDELIRAMRAGATYVNVHNATWPDGEIRGQIEARRRR